MADLVQIGTIVIYQTQNGDLIAWPDGTSQADKDAYEKRGEIYATVPAIVTSVGPNDTVGLVVFVDGATAPIAHEQNSAIFHVGGVDHSARPNGWRLQSEAGKDVAKPAQPAAPAPTPTPAPAVAASAAPAATV